MGTIMQDILIVVDYLRKQLGITAEYHCMDYPQTEEQFLNQLRWISGVDEHNSCLFTDEKLISWQQIQEYKDVRLVNHMYVTHVWLLKMRLV
jgi:hypothetical protein